MLAKTRLQALAALGFAIDTASDAPAEAAPAASLGGLDLDNPIDAFEALRRFASSDHAAAAHAVQ